MPVPDCGAIPVGFRWKPHHEELALGYKLKKLKKLSMDTRRELLDIKPGSDSQRWPGASVLGPPEWQ